MRVRNNACCLFISVHFGLLHNTFGFGARLDGFRHDALGISVCVRKDARCLPLVVFTRPHRLRLARWRVRAKHLHPVVTGVRDDNVTRLVHRHAHRVLQLTRAATLTPQRPYHLTRHVKHLHPVVAAVQDDNVVRPVHRHGLRILQFAPSGAGLSQHSHQPPRRVKHLHPVFAAVGDDSVACRVHCHGRRRRKTQAEGRS